MILTITGHRPPKLGGYDLPNPVFQAVMEGIDRSLIALRPERLVSGMALGVDQWALDSCILNDIPYTAAVPFQGFSRNWPHKSQEHFQYFMARADKVVYTTEGNPPYSDQLLHHRNQWMVMNSDAVLAVWDGSSGGTANCVRFAKACGKPVYFVQLNPEIWAMAKQTKSWMDVVKEQRVVQRNEAEARRQHVLETQAEVERRRAEARQKILNSATSAANSIAQERDVRARAAERLRRQEEEQRQRELQAREAREAEHRERMRRDADRARQIEEREALKQARLGEIARKKIEAIRAAEAQKKLEQQQPDEERFKPRRVLDLD